MAVGERQLAAAEQRRLNEILLRSERALTREGGIPGRPWFRHQIYAPGVYTGYAPKPMPGISEAVDQRRWREAEEQIAVVAATLENFTAEVEKATAILAGG
ncbi:MAG: hypothetical protein HC897_16675 [Thermoanaerobaculia bacterium]|nr:hypothetical protein [Thermoanaerobaculia bacterium]